VYICTFSERKRHKRTFLHAKTAVFPSNFTALFAASTSMSISFPVLDAITVQFFTSTFGTNTLAFSSDENMATLSKQIKNNDDD
jgi:hypothetical protein